MTTEDKSFLKEACKRCPFLVHARNILTKDGQKTLTQTQRTALDYFASPYVKYLKSNLALKGYSQSVVEKRVALLNGYYKYFYDYDSSHTTKLDKVFSSKSKFRPTVLEEFLSLALHDLIEELIKSDPNAHVEIGSVKAYANLYFYGEGFLEFAKEPRIGINEKDQDFAVYRNIKIQIDDSKPREASVPVVAIECKTYVDKTMFEGAAATAEKLKAGNPYTMFGIVAETYEIDKNFIPAYSRVDQVYVLRKGTRKGAVKPIDSAVVFSLVQDVKKHLLKPWVNIEKKLEEEGLLI